MMMQDQRTAKIRSKVDMSPEAVDQRRREGAQLYKLGISLRDAELLGPVEEMRRGNHPENRSLRFGRDQE